MMLFAHVGLTVAGTKGLDSIIRLRGAIPAIDYRLVILGSMLPDIIDKPLGGIILRESLGNGRIYSHTLLFLIFLFGTGIYLWKKKKKPWALILAWGSLSHHVLDSMWLYPETFLWPLYGTDFPPGNPENWLSLWMNNLLTRPDVFVPELMGLIFLLYFIFNLYLKKEIKSFIKTGRISYQKHHGNFD